MGFDLDKLRDRLAALAREGVYAGTSSWKYEGWLGRVYTPQRYEYRGKLAESRFRRNCLTEYAETFKTVSVDAAYYTFPTEKYLQGLAEQTPVDFLFSFKVTDEITIKRFPNIERFQKDGRAGKLNENFLNAELFTNSFLKPCETIRSKIGLLMFEFSRFGAADYSRGREFMADLDRFLGELPDGWRYGVEIRNRKFLHPEYLAMLRSHGVAHIFNSWENMPPVHEQITVPDIFPTPHLFGARLLLRPGRSYNESVDMFEPYESIKDPYPEGRAAAVELIRKGRRTGADGNAFIYVGNRF